MAFPHHRQEVAMRLYTIAVVPLIAWVMGLSGIFTMGAFVHLFLIVFLVMFVVAVLGGSRDMV